MKKNRLEGLARLYTDGRGLVADNGDGGFVAACPAMIVYKGINTLSVDDVTYSDGITLKKAVEVVNRAWNDPVEPYDHNKVNDLCKALRMPKERLTAYVGYLNDRYVINDEQVIGIAEGDGAVGNWLVDVRMIKQAKPCNTIQFNRAKRLLLYRHMYKGDEYHVVLGCLSDRVTQEVRDYLIAEGAL